MSVEPGLQAAGEGGSPWNKREPAPLLQNVARDHPARRANVCPISSVASKCRRSAAWARHRCVSL